jgi:hypothetical protein
MLVFFAIVWIVFAVIQGVSGHFESALGCSIIACLISMFIAMEGL